MYSQNNEEEIILNHFGKYFVGTFLDIGANDGITLSNTYALAKEGWSGVCVEASPKAYKRLKDAHPFTDDIAYYPYAIGATDGQTILWESGEHLGKGDTSLLSTINKEELNRWPDENFDCVLIRVLSFETFLKKSFYQQFHFISIDIEGLDVLVLKQMNLTKLDCTCLCIEWNSRQSIFIEIDEYMKGYGFSLTHKNAENLIYIKPK